MPKLTTKRTGEVRTVRCVHCGGQAEVAKRAMSIFCVHCKKRLILEDFKIRSYHATSLFATCGDIVVEKRGHVYAPIRVQNLTVHGQVRGDVEARGCVRIGSSGRLRGDIRAPRLVVKGGAVIDGRCHIAPEAPAPDDRAG